MSDVTKWWSTEIIDMKPGSINLRGKPIEDLIGKKSFVGEQNCAYFDR